MAIKQFIARSWLWSNSMPQLYDLKWYAFHCLQGLSGPVLIATPFPSTTDHNARHMELGPDNKLYITYGSPGNLAACVKYNNISECSIVRMNLNGTDLEDYAVGKRLNSSRLIHVRSEILHGFLFSILCKINDWKYISQHLQMQATSNF